MNESIKVSCFTNLDDYRRRQWPQELYCRPMLGDYVRSVDGDVELKIVRIVHTVGKYYNTTCGSTGREYILIELQ